MVSRCQNISIVGVNNPIKSNYVEKMSQKAHYNMLK